MKNRTIKQQFFYAISKAKNYGNSKWEYRNDNCKKMNEMTDKIFSTTTSTNLLETADIFSRYIKQYHSNIHEIKAIGVDITEGFIEDRLKHGCNVNTVKTYLNNLKKIEFLCNNAYNTKFSFTANINLLCSKKLKIRNKEISLQDYNHLLKNTSLNSELYKCLKLTFITGCRAKDLQNFRVKDIDFNNSSIKVFCTKGGLTYINKFIFLEEMDYLKSLCMNKNPNNKLISISYKTALNEFYNLKKKLNLDKEYYHISFHGIRKLRASYIYQMLKNGKLLDKRNKKYSPYMQKLLVERYVLGHLPKNRNIRKDLAETYYLK